MNNTFDLIIEGLAQRTAQISKAEDGDYIADDGLLYCGKCHTKKQCKVTMLGRERILPCICKCRKDEIEAEEAEAQLRKHKKKIAEMRRTGFPDKEMQDWNFGRDDGANEKITNISMNYVNNFSKMLDKGKGLLFYGNVGTGKTFYAACIANALIDKGYPCMMTNFSRLVNTISGMYEGKQNYIDSLNDFSLLVIDDLAAERDTEYMNEIVQTIIDSRYRAGLPTIITTNLTAEEIKNPADIRKQRTYSRLLEMCLPVEVKGSDRRRAKLVNDYAELNDLLGL